MNDKELIQAIRGAVQEELTTELTVRLGNFKEELRTELKGDLEVLKKELRAELKEDFGALKTELKEGLEVFKGELRAELKSDIKEEFVETKQILRALEHSAEVNKSTHDAMQNDIAHIKGDIEGLKDKVLTVEAVTADNWKEITKLKLASS